MVPSGPFVIPIRYYYYLYACCFPYKAHCPYSPFSHILHLFFDIVFALSKKYVCTAHSHNHTNVKKNKCDEADNDDEQTEAMLNDTCRHIRLFCHPIFLVSFQFSFWLLLLFCLPLFYFGKMLKLYTKTILLFCSALRLFVFPPLNIIYIVKVQTRPNLKRVENKFI